MSCVICEHFHYSSEPQTWHYPGSEDWDCRKGHEIIVDESGLARDFLPAVYNCPDFKRGAWWRGLNQAEINDTLGDMEYHRLKDEGKL